MSHEASVHSPIAQPPIPCAPLHTRPQTPQLFRSVAGSTSQPSSGLAEQCRYPGEHVDEQIPPVHDGTARGPRGQTVPQRPQLSESPVTLTSQPFDGLPSQSPVPGEHVPTTHRPAMHAATAPGIEHTLPHVPQLRASLARSKHTPPQH